MECRNAAEKLLDYAEDVLDDGLRAALEAHLRACPACRRELEDLRAGFSALDDVPVFSPSSGFAARVMRRMRETPRHTLLPWRMGRSRGISGGGSRYGRLAWAGAAALLVAAGLTFHQYGGRETPTAQVSQVSEADWRDDEIIVALDEALEAPIDARLSIYTLWEEGEADGEDG